MYLFLDIKKAVPLRTASNIVIIYLKTTPYFAASVGASGIHFVKLETRALCEGYVLINSAGSCQTDATPILCQNGTNASGLYPVIAIRIKPISPASLS